MSDELNSFKGTLWTVIVSIKRDDAEMLGFNTGERWRNMVRANRDMLAKSFKILPSSLQWYGAFHNESYHPHIHLIVFDRENKGYLDKEGIEKIKSSFAHVIFQDEMLNIQNEKTDRRDRLRLRGKDEINEILERIQLGQENNTVLVQMLIELNKHLQEHKGRKMYGYLNRPDKRLVNEIVDELEKIPAIKELYDLWYDKQDELYRIYSETTPTRVPLSENPDFKNLKNAVIRAAGQIEMSPVADSSEDIPQLTIDSMSVAKSVTSLLNSASKIFQDKFADNPERVPKVDIKLRRKIQEKEEAHGIKHG